MCFEQPIKRLYRFICWPVVCSNRPKDSFWSKIIWWELSSQPCILNFILVIPENTHVLAVALKCAALPWPSFFSISSKWGIVGDTAVPHNPWVVPHDRKKTCTTKNITPWILQLVTTKAYQKTSTLKVLHIQNTNDNSVVDDSTIYYTMLVTHKAVSILHIRSSPNTPPQQPDSQSRRNSRFC